MAAPSGVAAFRAEEDGVLCGPRRWLSGASRLRTSWASVRHVARLARRFRSLRSSWAACGPARLRSDKRPAGCENQCQVFNGPRLVGHRWRQACKRPVATLGNRLDRRLPDLSGALRKPQTSGRQKLQTPESSRTPRPVCLPLPSPFGSAAEAHAFRHPDTDGLPERSWGFPRLGKDPGREDFDDAWFRRERRAEALNPVSGNSVVVHKDCTRPIAEDLRCVFRTLRRGHERHSLCH
jgi:hypothetical protein